MLFVFSGFTTELSSRKQEVTLMLSALSMRMLNA